MNYLPISLLVPTLGALAYLATKNEWIMGMSVLWGAFTMVCFVAIVCAVTSDGEKRNP